MKQTIENYDELKKIDENLWIVDGEWQGSLLKRRMTIIRLKNGELLIHSAIRLKEEDYQELEKLGDPAHLVVPNIYHTSEAHFYKQRYPDIKIYCTTPAAKVVSKQCQIDVILPEEWPEYLNKEVECREFLGTKNLGEIILYHPESRTLVVTDIAFNMSGKAKGFAKLFSKLNQMEQGFGPTRIFKMFIMNDKKLAATSLHLILEWNFDRIIMNHGDLIESDGHSLFIQGFEKILK